MLFYSMDKHHLAPIRQWALGVATYRQPFAAIAAHRFWQQQNAAGEGRLIVVDSTEKPTYASIYYERIKDPRVLYFHMPCRPGRESVERAWVENYPKAYRWLPEGLYHQQYRDTIPDDETLHRRYVEEEDVFPMVAQDVAVFRSIVGGRAEKEEISHKIWAAAVCEFTQRGGFQNRPHLGSKRNFIAAVAAYHGAQAVVNYDDDFITRGYVGRQLKALESAHLTGRTRFLTVVLTTAMTQRKMPAIWGITDIELAEGYLLDHHGEKINEPVVPHNPMAWTHARRIGDDMPKVPDILVREGRTTISRYQNSGLILSFQREFFSDCARLICGSGSSRNTITCEVSPADPRLNRVRKRMIARFLDHLRKTNLTS
jgi:hypothetical protein